MPRHSADSNFIPVTVVAAVVVCISERHTKLFCQSIYFLVRFEENKRLWGSIFGVVAPEYETPLEFYSARLIVRNFSCVH